MTDAETIDITLLEPYLNRYEAEGRSALIPLLFEAQNIYGYLSEPVVVAIGQALRVPLADIHGVIEFYTMLYREPVGQTIIRICTSPVCDQFESHGILNSLCEHFGISPGETTPDGEFTIEAVPCLCLCDSAPAATVGDLPVGNLDPTDPKSTLEYEEVPLSFIGRDLRWLTRRCGLYEPTDLETFLELGGYQGLARALDEMTPAQVIEEIKASGLVGRGGAAFPTGLKWQFTASAEGTERYIVCNGDESEPGTFKDRLLMEGDPFAILEGMTISALAVGAKKGYIYIRGEYARAQKIMRTAIEVANDADYLGEKIMGSDFSFEVELRSGAGAYICGEETALFESIEGKRGFPRLKPPYPTTSGLFGKPTAINNVETLCTAAWILANGSEAYRTEGTDDSPGLKLFCLSGDVKVPGVYEAPFGIRLSELVEMAGSFVGEPQAILLGGAAGTFATPDELDLEMSFEGLRSEGHSLGSGVVMVINQDRDLRQTLYSLAEFFAHESCGKCFPWRLGTQRQMEIIEKVKESSVANSDLAALEDVIYAMTETSICGLGMTAGTAIGSALKAWPGLFSDDDSISGEEEKPT
jgi:NADH-quinone oxidoreductase subunit F